MSVSEAVGTTPWIRRVVASDAEAIALVFAGPEVIRGTLQLPYPSALDWRSRIEAESGGGVIRLVTGRGGEVEGVIGIHMHPDLPRIRHAAWLGMAVRDDCQGRGLGRALMAAALDLSDRWLGLRRLELTVMVDNVRAIRLYERFGFATEGRQRDAVFRDGRFVDTQMMGRLVGDVRST